MTLGDLQFLLKLDIRPYVEAAKSAQNIGKMTAKNIDDAFKLKPPTFSVSKIDAEVKKLDHTLKQLPATTNQVNNSLNSFSQHTHKASNEIKQKTNSLKGFASELRQIQRMLRLISGGFVAQLLSPIKQFVGESLQEFAKLEAANQRLLGRLGGDKKKFATLDKQTSSFPQIFSKAEIKDTQGILSGLTGDTGSIKDLTKISFDLAVRLGKNLPDAAMVLKRTLSGELDPALKELSPEFAKLTVEQLKNGDAIKLAGELTSGAADKFANSTGKLKIWENQWNDIKASFGEGLFTSVAQEISVFDSSLDGTGDTITFVAKSIGESIIFIAKWATIWGVVTTAIKVTKSTLDIIGVSLKDIKNNIVAAHQSLANLPSKIPIIGQFYDKIKQKAQEYLDKLHQIINAHNNLGGAINERKTIQLNSQGEPVTVGEGDKTPQRLTPGHKDSSPKEKEKEKKDLDEIEQKQEDLNKLQAEYNKLVTKYGENSNYVIAFAQRLRTLRLELADMLAIAKQLAVEYKKYERADGTKTEAEGSRRPGARPVADIMPDKNAWIQHWQFGIQSAFQIAGILNNGGMSLEQKFFKIVQLAIQAGIALAGSSIPGLGIVGTIISGIGSFLGFNKGTNPVVPGSGNQDTVPAMLTPGEVVLSVPRVRQLVSQYGSGVLNWLVGRAGDLLPAIPGHYNTGAIVQSAITNAVNTIGSPIMLNGRILDDRTKQEIASRGLYLESVSVESRRASKK